MESEELFEDLAAECSVLIEGTSGDISVIGWEEPNVRLDAPDCCQVRREGQSLHIALGQGGSEDLRVQLPLHCDLTIRGVSGDVLLERLAGAVSVQTTSGDIHAVALSGSAELHSVSGTVTLERGALESLALETVSGDVVLATSLRTDGAYALRTVSGDITLRLPEQQACTVRSHSLSGDVRCRLTHELYHQGWGRLDVAINGGGTIVRVRTTSGDLLIEPDESLTLPTDAAPLRAPAPAPADQDTTEVDEPFGLDVPANEEDRAQQRMRVLKAIEEGRISVSEGLETLRRLE